MTTICPCGVLPTNTELESFNLNKPYSKCCQPLHQGVEQAYNAERLMRSRYCAFVKVLPDYIIATTLPAQRPLLDKEMIKTWAEDTKWAGLEIVKHVPKLSKHHAQVGFKAYYYTMQGGSLMLKAHQELSTFVKTKESMYENDISRSQEIGMNTERWFFLDPTVDCHMSQKQPCICGSGQKFKRCCGKYI